MAEPESGWKIYYYTTTRGSSPPREYVEGLEPTERAKVDHHLEMLRVLGTALREPYAKHLTGTDLWELKPDAHRLIYVAVAGRRFVVLHAFRKSSTRTKKRDIQLALARRDELMRRIENE